MCLLMRELAILDLCDGIDDLVFFAIYVTEIFHSRVRLVGGVCYRGLKCCGYHASPRSFPLVNLSDYIFCSILACVSDNA